MIYDAFLLLNELDILDIRLHTMAPCIDKFIIVESNQTFSTLSGKGEFILEKNYQAFRKFHDKIIYIKLDGEYFTVEQLSKSPWLTRLRHRLQKNELADQNLTFTRNSLLRGLSGASPDDLVIISDVDEIINPACLPEAVQLLKSQPVVGFEQTMYRYFLNNREKDFIWTLPRITTCRQAFKDKPHTIRGIKKLPMVKNGGWHFTGVGNMENFLYKIQSIMHHDRCYKGKYRDINELKKIFEERVIRQRVDIFDFMTSRYEFVEVDETYPAFIRDNLERFRDLIYHSEP